jgi:threonine-phosphate decarboxylase
MFDHSNALAGDFLTTNETDFRKLLEPLDLQREHGGGVFAWARKTGLDPNQITDFSASINPLGPPAIARRAFLESYTEISRYPDAKGQDLQEAVALWHEVKPEEVLLGNGSTQLIYLLCRTLRPQKALVLLPAFSEYGNALKLVGAKVQSLFLSRENNFRLPLEQFLQGWEEGVEMAFLSNPNSVTGHVIPRAEMEKVALLALRKKIFLVVDEAFVDFAESESVKGLIRENPYLIVLRSLTKYYALPGLRIGYLLARPLIIEALGCHQEPWSVNAPAQRVAQACLQDATFRSKTSEWLEEERTFLMKGLASIKGVRPYPSGANFVLAVLHEVGANALELRSFLLRHGMLIRPCDSFLGLGADYFRVAVRLRKDNVRLLKGLKDFIRFLRSSR